MLVLGRVPSRELTYHHYFLPVGTFESMIFLFRMVGYVSFLESKTRQTHGVICFANGKKEMKKTTTNQLMVNSLRPSENPGWVCDSGKAQVWRFFDKKDSEKKGILEIWRKIINSIFPKTQLFPPFCLARWSLFLLFWVHKILIWSLLCSSHRLTHKMEHQYHHHRITSFNKKLLPRRKTVKP